MNEKLLTTAHPLRRVTIELRHDRDGAYRWYNTETDGDTEVSGRTPEEAWVHAAMAWGAPCWDIRKESPLTASVIADEPTTPPWTYMLSPEEHEQWYSQDQRVHDALHDRLRRELDPGTEILDRDYTPVDITPNGGVINA